MRSGFPYPHYTYKRVLAKKIKKPPPFFRFVYVFDDYKDRKYIAIVEKFDFNTYIVKYHPADFKNDPNKYTKLTGRGRVRPIIYTCIAIMLDILDKDAIASFGFVGARITGHKIAKKNESTMKLTKRFRVYREIISDVFGDEYFEHKEEEDYSAYVMINLSNTVPQLYEKLDQLFSTRYFQSDMSE